MLIHGRKGKINVRCWETKVSRWYTVTQLKVNKCEFRLETAAWSVYKDLLTKKWYSRRWMINLGRLSQGTGHGRCWRIVRRAWSEPQHGEYGLHLMWMKQITRCPPGCCGWTNAEDCCVTPVGNWKLIWRTRRYVTGSELLVAMVGLDLKIWHSIHTWTNYTACIKSATFVWVCVNMCVGKGKPKTYLSFLVFLNKLYKVLTYPNIKRQYILELKFPIYLSTE